MEEIKTYVQQLRFDGTSYQRGEVIELYEAYHIICPDFPFELMQKPKALPTRDWHDEDGLDVFVPAIRRVESYDINVPFFYKGTKSNIRTDIGNFIKFMCGRNVDAVGSRLAVYNEHTGIGRKDVVVKEIKNEIFYKENFDEDAVARFAITFSVYDPITDVSLSVATVNGTQSASLHF